MGKRNPIPLFDITKAKSTVEKGRRSSWWIRQGTSARNFKYLDAVGKRVSGKDDIRRIRALVIPPAWKFVRINPAPGGKIQAVGIDALGRVQYRYHPAFAEKQQKKKFAKIEEFGKALPALRRQTNEDIALEGLPRAKVLAVVMRLINSLYFRVGTDLSAKHYKTYGVTTLQKRHLKIGKAGKLSFEFDGKSHVQHRKILVDDELAKIIKELVSLDHGRKLFRYLDEDGHARPITPAQINSYIKGAAGTEFSAKDFRTWGATVIAAVELAKNEVCDRESERKKAIVAAARTVSKELGNTPAVCRNSYIHPAVLEAYVSGTTIDDFLPRRTIKRTAKELEPEEEALLRFFAARAAK